MNTETTKVKTAGNVIPLKEVQSSRLKSVGYDGASRTLAVQFHADRRDVCSIYHYFDVSPEAYERFVQAKSMGVHFGAHVMGAYEYRKVEPVVEQDPAPAERAVDERPTA